MASKRATRWIDSLISLGVGTGGQAIQTLFPGIGPDDLRNATIIRTIGNLWLFSETVAGAWGVQLFDLGIGVISQEAVAASIYPDPNVASDYPVRGWIYRTRCVVAQNGSGAPVLIPCNFDLGSQRKLDTGVPTLVGNNDADVGTSFSVRVRGSIRTLVLLP